MIRLTIAARCSFIIFLPLVASAVGCGATKPGGQGGSGGGPDAGSIVDASATDADGSLGPIPPPGCLPDCLVDAIRQCVPTFGACIVQKTELDAGLAFPRTETRTCDLATHWEVDQFSSYPFGGSDIMKDGQMCFGRRTKIVNVGGPGLEITYLSFGREIARGAEGSGFNAVACGEGTFVPLAPPSAECLPWRALMNPAATCTSKTDGVCP